MSKCPTYKVFCYRNLNRKGVIWSVRSKASGLVVDRTPSVVLSGVSLKVSQAGRKRVLRDKRKNVHAGIEGRRIVRAPAGPWYRAAYNPYKWDSFMLINEAGEAIGKIDKASYAKLTPHGLFVMI